MSAKFNLFITRESLRHVGGTKDYHVALVINRNTREAIFMNRFGKADQNGQFKFEVIVRAAIPKIDWRLDDPEWGRF